MWLRQPVSFGKNIENCLILPHFTVCYFCLPVILSVLNLIDGQYLQNVVFSFEMGSNGQNQSSPDSHLSWWKYFFQIMLNEVLKICEKGCLLI